MSEQLKILIIGNGMVGHHFVEQLVEQPPHIAAKIKITVLSGESRLAYDRVHLSEYFAGSSAESLSLTQESIYQDWQVDYRLSAWVENIDMDSKLVITAQGERFSFDKLVFATGSYPFVPPIPGNDQSHCLVYRTIEDLDRISRSAESSQVGVVVGGGLLGLEAANALKQLGLQTHVVEFAPQLMGVQLDGGGGRLLKQKIEELDVSVHTGKATEKIIQGERRRYRMCFADGEYLETDLVLFSAGIRPHDQLAKALGLKLGARGGIAINEFCETELQDVYAIGECAAYQDFIYGLVAPGYNMAKTLAKHITGQQAEPFTGADMSTKLKLMGVEVGSIGDALSRTPNAQSYCYENQPDGLYKKLVISADKTRLLGAVLVGDTSQYDTLLQYLLNHIPLPENPESLIMPQSSDVPTLGADQLPDSATICSCHNVTKAGVVAAIDSGALDEAEVKKVTKASTGCGGCAALLKNVVQQTLADRGVEVNNHVCEHFNYSRAELFELVRRDNIHSFSELLIKHGQGRGCDICKPAAASIFASIRNEYVLTRHHQPLQDTNDTYLANMQKDGTYSIVPRVPGGEITPDKLIVLGQVAKKHSLYTKITGGQRIDLFGARVEQLPIIWRELINAGFETGHAYGKSVRTVKSCVGSTWCRYGVQDSVGKAIELEHRYKGLRAPHKLKFAVSGCTRECAEAQSKDIGVIATEAGWNLYVCGNGGMKPRHADLFATDINDQQLQQYIDRILMYYIQTADRLQRTSVWMDQLEGGLTHLQQVVIEDSLGINQQLEQAMQEVVDSYQCEWQTTLQDPLALKRFRHFVNSEQMDEGIQFDLERGQIKPATFKSEIPIKQLI